MQLVQGETPPLIDAQQIHQFNIWLEDFASSSSNVRPQASNGILVHPSSSSSNPGSIRNGFSSTSTSGSHQHHPSGHGHHHQGSAGGVVHHSTPGATRFSPLLEVPKLERWFRENPNPSRQKLQYYMQILNGSNFRKHAGKITYQQICNWFSNARASHRKKDGAGGNGQRSTPDGGAQSSGDARPNSSGSATGQANHWVSKVFSNNVRNLSIAFNDFIQSAPSSKMSKASSMVDGGVIALNVASNGQSPSTPTSQQNQTAIRAANSPSLETSSTSSQSPTSRTGGQGSRDVSINVIRDDGLPMVYKEEEDEDGETRMRIVLENSTGDDRASPYGTGVSMAMSPSVSPMSISATLKVSLAG